MDLTLSWDLFVVVFFALVITYSFIIGKHESVKIIIASYIAIVAGQGAGNLLETMSAGSQPMLENLGLSVDITLLGGTKLLIFIIVIVFLSVRGGFEITYRNEGGAIANIVLTGIFGFVTGGLMLSTLLTFIANAPLLDGNLAHAAALSPMMSESYLMQIMMLHQDLWFALPAFVLIGVGIISSASISE